MNIKKPELVPDENVGVQVPLEVKVHMSSPPDCVCVPPVADVIVPIGAEMIIRPAAPFPEFPASPADPVLPPPPPPGFAPSVAPDPLVRVDAPPPPPKFVMPDPPAPPAVAVFPPGAVDAVPSPLSPAAPPPPDAVVPLN